MKRLILALVVLVAGARVAAAYPQLTLSHDATCTGCHISPSGGGLLNENGLNTAEAISQFGTAPEFMYGKVPTPSWLTLGGDLRGAMGYVQTPVKTLAGFPMQFDLYGHATFGAFSVQVTAGYRSAEEGNEGATHVWAREHYLMWQQKPGETTGLYIRAGRFLPVYGIRLAEHDAYTRRYGPTPLYADTYGLGASYIEQKYEAHLTAFIRDPLIDPVDHGNGVMAYAELRPTEHTAVGGEGFYKRSEDDKKFGGGVTGKVYIPEGKLLIQGELQYINQVIDKSAYNTAGGAPLKLIGYVLGTYMPKPWLWVDVGLGHFDSNLRIADLDRDNIDINIHWFATSHVELLWANRVEMLAFGSGGPTGAWSLLMAHYRL